MIGKTISHYRIKEKIGAGGMGEVFMAEDTKLKRNVALKFLPQHLTVDQEAKERFEREAQAAASLNHPNIITIHEIGEHENQTYIAMEHVDGETLRAKIKDKREKTKETVGIATQICNGLQKAHEAGIAHRDIKPENILIDNDGRVKILDFGLAKLKGAGKITKDTSTLGTVNYMSPEQAKGEDVDHRTDIWSLGVVLYEMLTGDLPFKGEYESAVIYSILNEEPKSIENIPPALQDVVGKTLNKNPDERYSNVSELLNDINDIQENYILKKLPQKSTKDSRKKTTIIFIVAVFFLITIIAVIYFTQTTSIRDPSSVKRLVVLPFENLGSSEDEYFADGITEEITSRLALLHGLGVISRSSAMQYRNTTKTTPVIGEELNVDYILTGTVRWDKSEGTKGRVIVTPRLIRVSDDIQLWSDPYDQMLESIFDVQIKIAEEVIKVLDITILEPEREELYQKPTNNIEAFKFFIRARKIMLRYWHTDQAKLENAVQLFEQALEVDPELVMAYVWLSEIHSWQYHTQFDFTEARQIKSKAAIDKALKLQPDLPEAKLYFAWYLYRVFRDYDRAQKLFKEVKKRRPNESPRLLAAIERRQGDWESSVLHFEEAFKLDPRRPRMAYEVAYTYMAMRKYNKAEYWHYKNLRIVPDDNMSKAFLAKLLMLWKGTIKAAQTNLNSIKKINIQSEAALTTLITINLLKENYQRALNLFDSLEIRYINDQHYFMDKNCVKAYVYNLLGDEIKCRLYADSSVLVINEEMKKNPNDPRYHSALGTAYAFQGKENEALSAAKRAIEIYPISLDAFDGPNYVYNLAWVYTIIGDSDKAIDKLEYLLSIHAGVVISKTMLKIDPKWNKLRDHPRFQELIK